MITFFNLQGSATMSPNLAVNVNTFDTQFIVGCCWYNHQIGSKLNSRQGTCFFSQHNFWHDFHQQLAFRSLIWMNLSSVWPPLLPVALFESNKNTAQTGKVKFKDHKTPKRSKGFSNSTSQCRRNRAFKCVLGFITAYQFFTYSLSVSVGFHFIILNWPADIKQL